MIHITGNEAISGLHPFEQALVDFYQAFNRRDAKAASDAWLAADSVLMYNPIGGVRRGYKDIADAYARIMSGKVVVYVEFYDYTVIEHADLCCVIGRERGFAERDGKKLELKIRTSRVFERHDDQWLQVHHHGSIDEPALLKDYQHMVLGQ